MTATGGPTCGGQNHSSSGVELPIKRSGNIEFDPRGLFDTLGWIISLDEDEWWKHGVVEMGDLYPVAIHEIGHALAFNGCQDGFAEFHETGELSDAAVRAYYGSYPRLDHYSHFIDGTNDPISKRGAFGNEWDGETPDGRWLVTKLHLLVAQAVGFTLRDTTPFRELSILDEPLAEGSAGAPYTHTMNAVGGIPAYYWTIDSGALSQGLSLDSFTGTISGTPQEPGTFDFTIRVQDSTEGSLGVIRAVNLNIGDGPSDLSDEAVLLAARDTLAGTASLNWSVDVPIAQWEGVTVRGTPERVTHLRLAKKGLDGTIPASLGSLTMLTDLNLSANMLTGSIPAELGNLGNLTRLNLRTNRLHGPIPPELGNLSSLERLLLHNNQLTGPIPDLSGLSNLKMLWLSGKEMALTGSVPAWLNTMAGLESVSLWGNDLSGPIPDLTGMTSLKLLKLQSNNLSGGVPPWLGDMTDTLRGLYIHDNPLGGTVPPELGRLTRLRRLWIHSSDLTGTIPPELGNMAGLWGLNLRDNSLTGTFPTELGSLINMRKLRLHNNMLTGSIPTELGDLSNLTDLWLSGNDLTGPIPVELGVLDNLKQLSLKNNELSGDIPAALGNLADTLTHLFLAGNGGLTGCVPAGLVAVASNDLDELGLQVCGEGVITPPDLAHYHPKLREAVLHPAPEMAGDKAFLADGELSESEVKALERAQSVFGIPAFYNAWELDTLELNEVQAALYMLSFYDPYTVVNDITADPADPEAEGARMTRALDDFGVYPGSCVYCKGQEYPREDWSNWNSNPTFHRTKLLNLVHHATVQADMLSPCDLNDFSEEELLALGVMDPNYVGLQLLYSGGMLSFTHSVRLTNELLDSASEGAAVHGVSDEWIANAPEVLVQPGEILSPFTHAIRATGGPATARGMELCLKAVEGIVDWDRKRYYHFLGRWVDTMPPYIEYIFPENPYVPPVWATFLVYEAGGQDKGERLAAQFRALNMPAVKDLAGIRLNENAERFVISRGRYGIFLPAFNLYIHRNIGFSITEREADIKRVVQNNTIPNHCALQRGGGSLQHGTAFVEYVCDKKARSFGDPPDGTFVTISAGTEHVCALMIDGTPVCWGSEAGGRSSPPAGVRFTTISAGFDHTCALMADGTPVCWGDDIRGQSSPPVGEKFTDISAGNGYTCALRQDGTPSCWGGDIFQRGSRNPREVKELFYSSRFRDIDAGESVDACGLLVDGGILCNTGRSIQIGQGAHSISTGIHGGCALRRDGSPLCWGLFGDLTPPAGEKFMDISVGSDRLACGLRTDGTAVCWGEFASVSPPAGTKFIDISVASTRPQYFSTHGYVCALSDNGAAVCWRH